MSQLVPNIIHYKDISNREFKNRKPMQQFTDFLKEAWNSRNFCEEEKNNFSHNFSMDIDLGESNFSP